MAEKSVWRRLRTYLLTGLFVWLPMVVTIYILKLIFSTTDSILGGIINRFLPQPIPGLGIVVTLVLMVITGMVAANYFGKKFIAWGESLLNRIPMVRGIYSTIKQLLNIFAPSGQESFKRVGLVEFPQAGSYSLVFITGEARGNLAKAAGVKDGWTVFLPTSPNPATGYLLILPKEKVIPVDIPAEEAMKIIVSGGVLESGK